MSIRPTRTDGAGAGASHRTAGAPIKESARTPTEPNASRRINGAILSQRAARKLAPVRLRPLEALNLAMLLALSAVTLVVYRSLPDPGDILLRFALMGAFLAVAVFLARRSERLPTAIRVAADFYPAAFIPFVFESLGPLIAAARGAPRDDLLIAADRALFGTDVTVWLERFARPWLTDAFFLLYASYYFLGLVLGAVLWRRSPESARRYIFTLTVCYFVSYVGYFLVPALGPRFALATRHAAPLETTPLARSISTTINELERTKLDVFPSGHAMIAAVVLRVAWSRARRLFWVLLPVGAGLIVSTVYCRYHYVVDVLAGLLLAFLLVPLGDRWYDRAAARAER